MKKYSSLIGILFLFSSCVDIGEIKSGDMKHIAFTKNYAIGTDSTIVIIDRESGKTLNTINRKD